MIEATIAAPASSRGRLIFDGDCPLCRKSVAVVRSLDWLHRLEFIDARAADQPLLHQEPIAGAPLLDEMHLLTPSGKRVYHGFGAFRWMAWRLPLCWLIVPLLYVPGVPWLGQRIYLWIARNRFHLLPCRHGACAIQKKE
jgi:predicted DCC family thiol-disulfide oxidoreductase YuxK